MPIWAVRQPGAGGLSGRNNQLRLGLLVLQRPQNRHQQLRLLVRLVQAGGQGQARWMRGRRTPILTPACTRRPPATAATAATPPARYSTATMAPARARQACPVASAGSQAPLLARLPAQLSRQPRCSSPAGLLPMPGENPSCVNYSNDTWSCGSWNTHCPGGMVCQGGICVFGSTPPLNPS